MYCCAGGVLALVLGLGVDHEAVGAVGDRVGAQAAPRPAGRCRRRTARRRRAGRWRAALRRAPGLNCAQRLVAPSELLTNTVDMPAAWARAAIAAMSPPSDSASSQIHMPLPLKATGSVPGAGAGPPTRGGATTVILSAFERRPARSETVTRDGARRGPGGHARDVADARALELGGQRAARPAERDAHALVDALAAELQLAADRHLDRGLAGRRGRRHAADPGQFGGACGRAALAGAGAASASTAAAAVICPACLHHWLPTA